MDSMTALFTRTHYNLLPEGFPAELIEGCLVKEPAPTYGHQRLQTRIVQGLLQRVAADLVLCAPADVAIDELNVFQPDVVVLREVACDDESTIGTPRLAIEILSPSTRERDRGVKCHRLLAAGVREVWLVDAETRSVERWSVDGCVQAGIGETLSSDAVPGFSLEPSTLFTPARG
jgi:Uma2 family endonuclease